MKSMLSDMTSSWLDEVWGIWETTSPVLWIDHRPPQITSCQPSNAGSPLATTSWLDTQIFWSSPSGLLIVLTMWCAFFYHSLMFHQFPSLFPSRTFYCSYCSSIIPFHHSLIHDSFFIVLERSLVPFMVLLVLWCHHSPMSHFFYCSYCYWSVHCLRHSHVLLCTVYKPVVWVG